MAAGTDNTNAKTPIRIMPPAIDSTPEMTLVMKVAKARMAVIGAWSKGWGTLANKGRQLGLSPLWVDVQHRLSELVEYDIYHMGMNC